MALGHGEHVKVQEGSTDEGRRRSSDEDKAIRTMRLDLAAIECVTGPKRRATIIKRLARPASLNARREVQIGCQRAASDAFGYNEKRAASIIQPRMYVKSTAKELPDSTRSEK
jgi:hypothetical protein